MTSDDRVTINIRLPRSVLDELDRIAHERLVSRSLLIERGIMDLADRLTPIKDVAK